MRGNEVRRMETLALIAFAIVVLLVPQISSGINTSPLITRGNNGSAEHHEKSEDHHDAKGARIALTVG